MYWFLESAGCSALAHLYWAGGGCTVTAVTLRGLTFRSPPAVLSTRCSRILRRDFHRSIGRFAALCNVQTCKTTTANASMLSASVQAIRAIQTQQAPQIKKSKSSPSKPVDEPEKRTNDSSNSGHSLRSTSTVRPLPPPDRT